MIKFKLNKRKKRYELTKREECERLVNLFRVTDETLKSISVAPLNDGLLNGEKGNFLPLKSLKVNDICEVDTTGFVGENAVVNLINSRDENTEKIPLTTGETDEKIIKGVYKFLGNTLYEIGGKIYTDTGEMIYDFESEMDVFGTTVTGRNATIYLTNGEKAVLINGNDLSVENSQVIGTYPVYFKGRLFVVVSEKIVGSSPLKPSELGEDFIDFIVPSKYGRVVGMMTAYDRVYVFCENGIFRFTEKKNRQIHLEEISGKTDGVIKGTIYKCCGYIYFCTALGVYRVVGKKISKVKRLSLGVFESLDATSIMDRYFLSFIGTNDDGIVEKTTYIFFNGELLYGTLSSDFYLSKNAVIFRGEFDEIKGEYVVYTDLNNDLVKGLTEVEIHALSPCKISIFGEDKSRTFLVKKGYNRIKVGIKSRQFAIKIDTPIRKQIIKNIVLNYYE